MTTENKIYEFMLDEVQINHIRRALECDRYAVASITEDDEKKRTDQGLEDAEIGHNMVEDLDELIALFTQLDNRLDKENEKFYLRCCVVPEPEEGDGA
jgi:hypothetical protein